MSVMTEKTRIIVFFTRNPTVMNCTRNRNRMNIMGHINPLNA
jgi:hypothetical protein